MILVEKGRGLGQIAVRRREASRHPSGSVIEIPRDTAQLHQTKADDDFRQPIGNLFEILVNSILGVGAGGDRLVGLQDLGDAKEKTNQKSPDAIGHRPQSYDSISAPLVSRVDQRRYARNEIQKESEQQDQHTRHHRDVFRLIFHGTIKIERSPKSHFWEPGILEFSFGSVKPLSRLLLRKSASFSSRRNLPIVLKE